jgi:hypothetical protein
MRPAATTFPTIAATLLTACAGSQALSTTSVSQPAGAYVLSANELDYDCKQLTGRMQIRILAIRDYNTENNSSLAARALQSGSAVALGGSKAGTQPDRDYTRDRAMLEAYNRQLAAKSCKTYDLDAELQPKDFRVTPTASIKPFAPATN